MQLEKMFVLPISNLLTEEKLTLKRAVDFDSWVPSISQSSGVLRRLCDGHSYAPIGVAKAHRRTPKSSGVLFRCQLRMSFRG